MVHQVLLREAEDGIVELRLNRPEKLNALDDALFDALVEAVSSLAEDRTVRAVILCGEGRAFCAGLDLSSFRAFAEEAGSGQRPFARPGQTQGRRQPGRGQHIVRGLRTLPVPVIAAIDGAAMGGGLQIALGADIRLVSPDAKLAVRELDFGITQDMGGTQLLPKLIGHDKAMDLILSGRIVNSSDAVSIGLATRVAEEPTKSAWELARAVLTRSPEAVMGSKRLLRLSEYLSIEEGMRAELDFMAWNIGRPNQSEATRARLDKRPPRFEDAPAAVPLPVLPG